MIKWIIILGLFALVVSVSGSFGIPILLLVGFFVIKGIVKLVLEIRNPRSIKKETFEDVYGEDYARNSDVYKVVKDNVEKHMKD